MSAFPPGGAPPLWKVIGTCRWTGYDFAGHQYWHRVSNWPNVVITIGTGYQIGLMWSSPLTQGIKIGLRLSQDRVPIVFYDRPAIQAEAMTFFFFFFFFFFACQLSIPNQTGYIRGVQYCNRVCIWMFLVRYIMTGCIFRAPSAIWQGQVLTPPAAPPYPVEKSSAPPGFPTTFRYFLYFFLLFFLFLLFLISIIFFFWQFTLAAHFHYFGTGPPGWPGIAQMTDWQVRPWWPAAA